MGRWNLLPLLALGRLYLAAAGETSVVVGRPAGAVTVMLVLKEAGVGVLFKLFVVFGHHYLIYIWLLNFNPGPRLAVIGHMDLQGWGEGGRWIGKEERKHEKHCNAMIDQ